MDVQVTATATVDKAIAEQFPQRPDLTAQAASEVEARLRELAAERNRHLSERPQLTDLRDTGLGFVELTFVADTEAD